MAVFFDTGGGDIYGGPTKEAVIAAMRDDIGAEFDESAIEEVGRDTKMALTDENEEPTGELETLAVIFGDSKDAYLVATTNC